MPASTHLHAYIGGEGPIACLALDLASGVLSPLHRAGQAHTPSYLAWDASGTALFAVDEISPGRILAYRRQPESGALTYLASAASGGDGPCHCSVHPSGRWLFTADYRSGTLGILPIPVEGGIGDPVQVLSPGAQTHMALCDASGTTLYALCKGADHIAQYRFDPARGRAEPLVPAVVRSARGDGPRHLAFLDHGRAVAVINELASTITMLRRSPDGGLSPYAFAELLPASFPRARNTAAAILVHPSGRFLYASNRGHDSIALVAVEAGRPRFLAWESAGDATRSPRGMAMDEAGRWLVVASQDTGLITSFAIDAVSGRLTRRASLPVAGVPQYVGLAVPGRGSAPARPDQKR